MQVLLKKDWGIGALLCAQLFGCASQDTPCNAGLERCECLPGGGCDEGLECRSDVCVAEEESQSEDHGALAAPQRDAKAAESIPQVNGLGSASEGAGVVVVMTTEAEERELVMDAGSPSPVISPESSREDASAAQTEVEPDAAEPPPMTEEEPLIIDERPSSLPCGNGALESEEVCDDGNAESNDGCAGNCLSVEPGFSCGDPGFPCMPIAVCGDGIIAPVEQCDDQNLEDGDGCSSGCRLEVGMRCDGQPSSCMPTICGDGVQEGRESCDDGNAEDGDGCSAECGIEPDCDDAEICMTLCGDGLVVREECDDGNLLDGDGCSSECTVEPGFYCRELSASTTCEPICGDGIVSLGEQCDDAVNDGGYGECAPGCVLGDYCGDGVVNGPELCDDSGPTCPHCRLINTK